MPCDAPASYLRAVAGRRGVCADGFRRFHGFLFLCLLAVSKFWGIVRLLLVSDMAGVGASSGK